MAETLLAVEITLASIAQLGKRCLLVVDDAQTLSAGALESLRMLSNLQLGRYALLQVILVGEPRLRNSVQDAGLRQRVICACHLDTFNAGETRQYVGHRLEHAGMQGGLEIRDDAYEAIHAASTGVARRVNSLCDRVLLSGFLEERRVFGAADINRVAAEYEAELAGPPGAPGTGA
jgi:type II secretory pathway predicted ATPase ExeA